MIRKLIYLIANIVILVNTVGAQDYYFKSLVKPADIQNATINCMLQDHNGIVWLGTSEGLFRTNGKNLIHYTGIDTIFNNPVTALFEDSERRIWTGFRNGQIARLAHGSSDPFLPEEGFPKVAISDITEDQHGVMWFATYGEGLYFFKEGRLFNLNTDDGLTDDYCYCLEVIDENHLWTGTDAGISICSQNKVSGRLTELPDLMVTALHKDEQENVWIGFQEKGMAKYHPETGVQMVFPETKAWIAGTVNAISGTRTKLVAATQDGGILFAEGTETGYDDIIFQIPEGQQRIKSVMTDDEVNIWINTGTHIYLSNGLIFRFMEHGYGNVQAIHAGRTGKVWFAATGGLFSFSGIHPQSNDIRHHSIGKGVRNERITSLYEDTSGRLWIGTLGDGLYVYQPVSGMVLHFNENNGLINNNILSITGDMSYIWTGTLGGASRIDFRQYPDLVFQNFDRSNGLINNYIYSVMISPSGEPWFATDGHGLARFKDGKFLTYAAGQGLTDVSIYSIAFLPNGQAWCSSSGNHVFYLEDGKFSLFRFDDDLSSENISSLRATGDDRLLVVRERSLVLINANTNTFITLSPEEGINIHEPGLNAITEDKTGNVWLGVSNGLIRYSPVSGKYLENPKPLIEKVLIFMEPLQDTSRNRFKSHMNHVSFDISAIWFRNPNAVTFRYMLEGYDIDWLEGKTGIISYSNLPPGSYHFRVQSSLGKNFSAISETSYAFSISPPLWKRWWFILLILLAAGSGLFLLIRRREKRLAQLAEMKKEQIRFQFELLKSQINPHFLFNSFSTLMGIIDEDREKAMTYVEKLSAFFRNILQYRDAEFITLKEELKLLDNYLYIIRQRYPENLTVKIELQDADLQALIPPLTLQLLVENAIKHNVVSSSKPLTISINSTETGIRVNNNLQEKTVHASHSTGFGLQSIKNRYIILCGKEPEIIRNDQIFSVLLPRLN